MTHPTTAAGATADAGHAMTGHDVAARDGAVHHDSVHDGEVHDGAVHDDAVRTPGITARSLAEGAGSFLVILVGLGATMLATETALQPTLVFGFAVVAAMIAFGHVSGGHFNPAITIGSAVAGRTAWNAVVPYVVAQLLGAVAASGLIWLVLSANPQLTGIRTFFSSSANGFGEHSPVQFPLTSAFLLEVVASALLVAVFLGATSKRARRDLAPFAVGLTFAGLLSFLLPVTNGGINPVRAAASAIFAETWALEQLWLFWAAPIIGGLIAGLVFRSVDSWGTPRRDRSEALASAAPSGVAEQQEAPAYRKPADADSPAGDAASFFDSPAPGAGHGESKKDVPGNSGTSGSAH